jgi:general stress protein 26
MPTPADLEEKLWKALQSDRAVMLRLDGAAEPMTAQFDKGRDHGPLYIFTSKKSDIVRSLGRPRRAEIVFVGKGHDIFATVEGDLTVDSDPALIDRLWNPFVAAWFEGGQNDPDLQLLEFRPAEAQIWETTTACSRACV